MIKAVLLDVDGTLVDSNDAHAKAWVDALKDAGFAITYNQVRPLIGMGSDNLLPTLLKIDSDDPLGEELSKYRGEIFQRKYLKTVRPFPKVRELLTQLLDKDLKLVIATSASQDDLEKILMQGHISDLLKTRVNADDAKQSKPDPDIVLAALKKARVKKSEAVMVGDTPYDLSAAHRAGIRPIGFTCGGWAPKYLSSAIEIYKGPSHLLENIERSFVTWP